ncbi:PREDICTED: protein TIC 20-IV, chloroplastic-like [Camelina sativa]|uniref:Protein TIC 20 n=1 Tax=Camelina sativa TaxID=90675 RepID=A0ABM0TDA9_CAMSA|nr:PREDICTED: protein TIC 20-IV, chloroplastic-like [Camelina sativa]
MSSLQRKIVVPLLGDNKLLTILKNSSSSSSLFNNKFVHDPSLTKHVRASEDENSIPAGTAKELLKAFHANAHVDFASSSNQLLGHGLPPLADLGARRNPRPRKPVPVKAYYRDENISRFRLPKTEERPEWFWMIMACVPYLISLKMSEIGFYMKPFLQQHGGALGETIIKLIPGAAKNLQYNFFMVYCVLGFAWVVKNRNLPYYFRYHMIMGILVETAMQIIWRTSEFSPLINFNGRLAIRYHMVVGFSFLCVLLECLRCALAGAYPQIPILSDAAYITSTRG